MSTASDSMRLRTRFFMLGAFLVATVAFAVIAASGIGENLVYYWTPGDLRDAGDKAYGASIRLGGMVVPGSIRKVSGTSGIEFDVKDSRSVVHVKTTGVPPQMFRENIGVVVEGTLMRGGHFQSNRLMVSHSNEYKAPKKGHAVDEKTLKQMMKSTDGLTE